jgi:hypothetical protein
VRQRHEEITHQLLVSSLDNIVERIQQDAIGIQAQARRLALKAVVAKDIDVAQSKSAFVGKKEVAGKEPEVQRNHVWQRQIGGPRNACRSQAGEYRRS